MGNRMGHNEAQSLDEMLSEMQEQQGAQKDVLKELITGTIEEIAHFATKERIALEDLEEVQKRTILYLRACEKTSTFPSVMGLARSLGYSERAIRFWRAKRPETGTAQWFEMFRELCEEIIAQYALKNSSTFSFRLFLSPDLMEVARE